MIEASLRRLPPDPRWLDFAGFVAPLASDVEDSAPESRAGVKAEDEQAEVSESREFVGSVADR